MAEPTTSGPPTSTTPTTSMEAPPAPPPPLTHRQFIRRLDHLCKVGNKATNRRFDNFGDISDTAASMDAYARWLVRVNRYVNKWDRRHHFFGLDPAEARDIRNYRRYKALTKELRNLDAREIVAARHHQFDELVRLNSIEGRVRNRRTRLTARMGLVYCGS